MLRSSFLPGRSRHGSRACKFGGVTDVLFEMPRAQLPTWLKAVMYELTMMEPVRREFLIDPELRAVQVIDLLAVGLGKAPSPGAYPLDLGGGRV